MNASEQPKEEWLHGNAPEVPDDQLLSALGDDFLAYLCATDPERIERVRQGEPLDEPRRRVWDAALRLAREFSLWRRPNASNDEFVPPTGQEFEPLSACFGRFFELTGSGVTVADALRVEAGGSLRNLPNRDDDLLRHALHWLARDLWPYLLLPPDRPRWAGFSLSGIGAAALSHPAQRELREALQQMREPVRQLYPDASEEFADSVRVASSRGTTGSVQVALLAERLIAGAAERCNSLTRLSGDEVLTEIDRQLEELRLLARRRPVEVPATVGLSGLELPPGHVLRTALGDLRPVTEDSAEGLPGSPTPNVMLTLTFPLRYTRIESDEPTEGAPRGFWQSWREFEARIDLVRLAVLLAHGPESGFVLRRVSEQVHDPLFGGGLSGRLLASGFSVSFDPAREDAIVEWAERIHACYRPEIGLAVRRTISAADGLRAPDDALVDAVIALEALFGTGETEVGFRLQTALAFLLGDDESARRAIHTQVGELYDARSKLVHGTELIDQVNLYQLRGDAVQLAVRCLKLLFSTHRGLIPDQGRGKRVILAGGRGLAAEPETGPG
jgi:hypothetical protein